MYMCHHCWALLCLFLSHLLKYARNCPICRVGFISHIKVLREACLEETDLYDWWDCIACILVLWKHSVLKQARTFTKTHLVESIVLCTSGSRSLLSDLGAKSIITLSLWLCREGADLAPFLTRGYLKRENRYFTGISPSFDMFSCSGEILIFCILDFCKNKICRYSAVCAYGQPSGLPFLMCRPVPQFAMASVCLLVLSHAVQCLMGECLCRFHVSCCVTARTWDCWTLPQLHHRPLKDSFLFEKDSNSNQFDLRSNLFYSYLNPVEGLSAQV